MQNDIMVLNLDGNISVGCYAKALERFNALIKALNKDVGEGADITWIISRLQAGSILTEARGVPAREDAYPAVERVTDAYFGSGEAIAENRSPPYSPEVQKAALSLASLNGDILGMRWENAKDDVTLERTRPQGFTKKETHEAYGGIEGRVQTLSSRGSLRFTLYDLLHDRAVSCYLTSGAEETMRDVWGKLALVEGWVKRDAQTGRPITIRQIRNVTLLAEYPSGSYRDARGAVRRQPGQMRGEEIIRRLRDAG
jgi:hypothetical protein